MIIFCSICQTELALAQPVDENQPLGGVCITMAPCQKCSQQLRAALEQSVQLQSHYAKLLNQYDGGQRIAFESADAWLARLWELAAKERL